MSELADLSVRALLDLYETQGASPVEAVESCLKRIERVDRVLNAVVLLRAEQCLDEARSSARRWLRGEPLPLDGVPFGLKDVIETAGVLTTGGSRIYRNHVPSKNAVVVERLQNAGALLLAKLHTDEFASGTNQLHAPARNPWNVDHSPGGSSSGSAVAVAAGEIPFSLGSDTGGSIRVPAAFCGIVGFKPTFGLVPRTGVMPLSWSLDTIGPMTRTVVDSAVVLSVIAGGDPSDPLATRRPIGGYRPILRRGVAGLRVGLLTGWFLDSCDTAVRDATLRAISILEREGAIVRPIELGNAHVMHLVGRTIIEAEAASLHREHWNSLSECSPDFAQRVANGQTLLAVDYIHALQARSLIQRDLEIAFEKVDVLVGPTTVSTAPPLNSMEVSIDGTYFSWKDVVPSTTRPFSIAGCPALTVPNGLVGGLPVGIQVVSPPHQDGQCLQIGHELEALISEFA